MKEEVIEEPIPTPLVVKFATEVQPIFHQNCGAGGVCHSSSTPPRGIKFLTHEDAIAVSETKLLTK